MIWHWDMGSLAVNDQGHAEDDASHNQNQMPNAPCRMPASRKDSNEMTRRIAVLTTIFMALVLVGCGKGGSTVRLSDLAPATSDTITVLLVGLPPEQRATRTTVEPALMKADVYETAVISADAEGFATASRGRLTVRDIETMQKDVVNRVSENLKPHRFKAQGAKYPATVSEPKTLLLTLTPVTQETGSPEERAAGKGKTLVLVHLKITDPLTGAVLAERQYYSGTDAKNQSLREFR